MRSLILRQFCPAVVVASLLAVLLLPTKSVATEPVNMPAAIEQYRSVLERCRAGERQGVAIRAYRQGSVDYRLTVDPRSHQTRLEKAADLQCDATSVSAKALLSGTTYQNVMDLERENEQLLQDAGLVRSLMPVKGYS